VTSSLSEATPISSRLVGLRCIRCGTEYPAGAYFKGCPSCLSEGLPTNLAVIHDLNRIKREFDPRRLEGRTRSIWRYAEFLPAEPDNAVSLGEGMTPLLEVPRLGRRLGIPKLFVKDESRNPTWSFKDRLASSAVSMAVQMGAKVITGSSSGNAGSATAAYSARAGIPCVMFTTQQFPLTMRVQMGVYGTKMIATPTIRDRWKMVEACVDEWGWFPVTVFVYPLVGSNCYGIEGYKTVAFELVEQLGRPPTHVVMPVGAGDAFYGTWKGFKEYRELGFIDELPTMIAAEVFGPLENALAKGLDHLEEVAWGPTPAISVGLNTSAYQALVVLRESGGAAASPTEEEIVAMQRELAESEGIYSEMSSVISLCVARRMAEEGKIDSDDVVVAFLTSSGLKDPEATARHLPAIPLIEPDLDALRSALESSYGFSPQA
jgi:threonine synthase